jgi:hypothetical protein
MKIFRTEFWYSSSNTEWEQNNIHGTNMEAVRTSETSFNFNVTTRRYIPEDSKLQNK